MNFNGTTFTKDNLNTDEVTVTDRFYVKDQNVFTTPVSNVPVNRFNMNQVVAGRVLNGTAVAESVGSLYERIGILSSTLPNFQHNTVSSNPVAYFRPLAEPLGRYMITFTCVAGGDTDGYISMEQSVYNQSGDEIVVRTYYTDNAAYTAENHFQATFIHDLSKDYEYRISQTVNSTAIDIPITFNAIKLM